MEVQRWHRAAPIGAGSRAIQWLVLVLVTAVVGPIGIGLLWFPGSAEFAVTGSELVVTVRPGFWSSERRASLESIERVEVGAQPLGRRLAGTAKPGHCSGWFRRGSLGRVWEASSCGAETVFVHLPDAIWSLGAADNEALAAALRRARPGTFRPPAPPAPPLWWRGLQALTGLLLLLPLLIAAAILVPVRYGAAAGVLRIRSPLGTREFSLQGASAAQLESPAVGLRLFGMGLPGAWLGIFRVGGKATHVWATQRRGRAVLIEGEKRVLVTPAEPEALLDDLRSAGAHTAE